MISPPFGWPCRGSINIEYRREIRGQTCMSVGKCDFCACLLLLRRQREVERQPAHRVCLLHSLLQQFQPLAAWNVRRRTLTGALSPKDEITRVWPSHHTSTARRTPRRDGRTTSSITSPNTFGAPRTRRSPSRRAESSDSSVQKRGASGGVESSRAR